MLFTEDHIFLAFPKTGSTYVRHVIKSAGTHLSRRRAFVPSLFRPKNLYYEQLTASKVTALGRNQHGSRKDINEPPSFQLGYLSAPMRDGLYKRRLQSWKNNKKRQIVSVWRDPVERAVSSFKFQHYSQWIGEMASEAKSVYPDFPDLTFAQFYETLRMRMDFSVVFPSANGNFLGIGVFSWQFIEFFASESFMDTLKHTWPSNAAELMEGFLLDTQNIKFLDQRFLSKELALLMNDSAFVLSPSDLEQRVNTTIENRHFVSSYEITEEDLFDLRLKEDFLYQYWEKRSLASEKRSLK